MHKVSRETYMSASSLVKVLAVSNLLPFISTAHAEKDLLAESKPVGVNLEWYQHEMDMNVTDIDLNVPGITDEIVDGIKGQLNSTNEVELLNLKLDYQVRPYLNIYGAIGKVTNNNRVGFSELGFDISDLEVESDGTAYTAGAVIVGRYGQLLPSLHLAHSRIDLDNNDEDIKVSAAIPSLGWQTNYGVFNASLLYQKIDVAYTGTVTAPLVGEVPVTVHAENDKDLQLAVGWLNRLGKDFYLNASTGLNGQQQFQIQLNKRF